MTAEPIPWDLLPDSAEVVGGRLQIGGCDVIDVAEEFPVGVGLDHSRGFTGEGYLATKDYQSREGFAVI